MPRSVTGGEGGLTVRSRWRSRHTTWGQLRRVRRAEAGNFPRHGDVLVERADGTLLALPPGMPGGTIEDWRERAAGERPPDELPQTWLRYDPSLGFWPLWVAPMVGQLLVRLIDRDWALLAVFSLMAGITALIVVLIRRRPPAVIADVDGLILRGLRQRHIAWSDVREIGPVDRFDATATVELADGSKRTLTGVPVEVAEHWRSLVGDLRT